MVKSIHPYEILREPIITEKSTALALQGKYVFEVHEPQSLKLSEPLSLHLR